MNTVNNIKKRRKSRFIGILLFLCSSIVILAGYLPEALSWSDTSYVTTDYALLFTGICIVILVCSSFIISLFPRRISIDKKILINLGLIAVAYGITGITGLVFKNEISFVDALYKTFQLFVGEFGDISYEAGSFPLLLNISRFLALFVTFGAITVLVLREKISQLNIRLFYRDVVIITDKIDKRLTALADKLNDSGRKIVMGIIKPTQEITFQSNEQIPVIEFDVDKTLSRGLHFCNVKNAKCIYLFCENTSDNIVLLRNVNELFKCQWPRKIIRKAQNQLNLRMMIFLKTYILHFRTDIKKSHPKVLSVEKISNVSFNIRPILKRNIIQSTVPFQSAIPGWRHILLIRILML